MDVLSEETFRKLGIEGVISDILPLMKELRDQHKETQRLLEIEKVKNAEQIKIIEAMVRGLRS